MQTMDERARALFDFIDRHLCAENATGHPCHRSRPGGPCYDACTENIAAIAAALRAVEADTIERCAGVILNDCHDGMTREQEAIAIRFMEKAP